MPNTLGIIFGNRDFFPDHLVSQAREDIFELCEEFGLTPIALTTEQSKLGGVETHSEARQCADLFNQHRDEIDGILVVLPNSGDEKPVDFRFLLPVAIRKSPD